MKWALTLLVATLAVVRPAEAREEGQRPATFKSAVDFLPQRINPRRNRVNVDHYVNLQLYYPLFSRDDTGQLRSEYLDLPRTRAVSASFDQYVMCIKQGATFTDASPIRACDLVSTLKAIHGEGLPYPPLNELLLTSANCVTVSLGRKDPRYFDKLMDVATAILKEGTEQTALPVGWGPYTLIERDSECLHLRANKPNAHVQCAAICRANDTREAVQKGFEDVNLMNWDPDKTRAVQGFAVFPAPRLRAYALVVSLPDPALRRAFVGCFDQDMFLKEAMPLDLVKTPGYLPRGALGAAVEFDPIKRQMRPGQCTFARRPKVRFYNQIPGNGPAIRRFIAKAGDSLPVDIEVVDFDRAQMISVFTSHEPQIFMGGVDALNSVAGRYGEPAIFFEVFTSDTRFTKERLSEAGALAGQASRATSREAKNEFYRQAHANLLGTGYVVPLG